MSVSIENLNKAFENRVRLGIMSALSVNDKLDFNSLKKLLEVTDGNLASHLKGLEKEKYISVQKAFIDRKPNTNYYITQKGKKAFEDHIKELEKLIKSQK